MNDDNSVMKAESRSVVVRSQKMAAALSSYARSLTFENRSRRNLYRLAGLAPRVRDRFFSILLIVSFVVCFLIPFTGSVAYYAFVASPQYVSEVRFIVRSSAPLLSRDRYSSENVEPKAKIVQDTAVLLNYLGSPAMVQGLEQSLDIRQLFGRDDIDYFSRLAPDASQEKIVKYWKQRHSASVNPKSGIVELEVAAFSPKEANALISVVLKLAETQINKLNAGMWDSLRASAEHDVEQATTQLDALRAKLRDTQNRTGIFDIDLAADGMIAVLTTLESDIAQLKSRREALSQSVSAGSPRLADIDRQIAARVEQVRSLRARTAGNDEAGGAGNLAEYSRQFEQLKLDLKVAESKLESAVKELEKVKLVGSLQLVYVDNFTDPTFPDDSKYPNVPLRSFFAFLQFAALFSVAGGAVLLLRKKFD